MGSANRKSANVTLAGDSGSVTGATESVGLAGESCDSMGEFKLGGLLTELKENDPKVVHDNPILWTRIVSVG